MHYADAIKWLKEHDVKKDDGTYYEFGEVTACTHAHTHRKIKMLLAPIIKGFYRQLWQMLHLKAKANQKDDVCDQRLHCVTCLFK